MKVSRRKFIGSAALASAALFLPEFLRSAGIRHEGRFTGRRLVIIQLSGGNDGLNTVIPFEDDLYYRLRPSLSLSSDQLIKINDLAAWNNALLPLHRLYENGEVAILNRVGYPNPDFSHFKSMDIWHSASAGQETVNTGWIGRYLDSQCAECNAHVAIEFDDTLSMVMKGAKSTGLALKDPVQFYRLTGNIFKKHDYITPATGNEPLDYMYKVMADAKESAGIIKEKFDLKETTATYPDHAFGKDLKTIASLINAGLDTTFYYVSLSGFDTHVNQLNKHNNLLKTFSGGISAFCDDLKKKNEFKNTLIMVFSEFGRRVKQNASNGTDHGAANVMLLIGGNLKQKGLLNPVPDLSKLLDGNLDHEIDFRSVYATILSNWLWADAEKILGKQFDKLDFI
jgi:uncharacterized protein (DUF1501 family)